MNFVLTMAEQCQKFKLLGSNIPKYLLPLGTETILSKTIEYYKQSCDYLNIKLIANKSDQMFYPIVKSIMAKHSISHHNLMYIDDTSSQLETALFSSDLISDSSKNKPVAFSNIDTILKRRNSFFSVLYSDNINAYGMVDTFNGTSPNYAYARTSSDQIIDIVDKTVISDQACSGLYGVSSFSNFLKDAAITLNNKSNSNFTDFFKFIIARNKTVKCSHSINSSDTVVLGTPKEYVVNIHRFE